jgi:acyl carrier protein
LKSAAPPDADVLAGIRAIAAAQLDLAREIEPGDDLSRDLELDSLRLVMLAVAIESHFRIELSAEDSAHVRTIADLCRLVADRVREAP